MLALLLTQPPVFAAEAGEALAARAIASSLHEERAWRALLHYRPATLGILGASRSLVDDPGFFLSPKGKNNPAAELEATVLALASPAAPDAPPDSHVSCRFPARRRWIIAQMEISEAELPRASCPGLDDYLSRVKPRSATLVFPESHMNSPASMFGHTLIRIDNELESKLVSHAINYAAFTDDTFGPFYAFKGIFGVYKGYFSVMPYYERINRYSSMENRAIWEYRLNLTEDEVLTMALHVWEMKEKYSYYYFFDENCSYMLMFMLEAARPSANLTSRFGNWTIPVDTIRAAREAGLVEDAVYRPSRAARLSNIARLSSPEERALAREVARGQEEPSALQRDEKASAIRTADMSAEYLSYLFEQREIPKEQYTPRFLSILAVRSRLGPQEYDIPTPDAPETGHRSSRVAIGLGRAAGEDYVRMRYRPAFHGLEDPDTGFTSGAAISFFDVEARHFTASGDTKLERLDVIDISSLAPVDDFFGHMSWRVNTGFARERTSRTTSRTPALLQTGGGYAFGMSKGLLVYGFLGPEVKAGGAIEKGYTGGMRLTAGALLSAREKYKAHIELSAAGFFMGEKYETAFASLIQNLKLGPDSSLSLSMQAQRIEDYKFADVSMAWNLYF